jgi:hypothetical protein
VTISIYFENGYYSYHYNYLTTQLLDNSTRSVQLWWYTVMALAPIDNGGRRSDIDRRQFSYTYHIPEKRSLNNRRSGIDRRSGLDQRSSIDRRSGKVIEMRLGKDRREGQDRRSGLERRKAFAAALAY